MTPVQRHNAFCNVTGEGLWGFSAALVSSGTVLTVLLLRLGAHTSTIGLIPAMEGAALLLQIVGVQLFRHHRTRKRKIVLWHYLAMIPFLAVMGVAVLAHARLAPQQLVFVLLCGWALFVGAIGVVGAAWADWIAHLFDEKIRGTVTGMSWGFSSLTGVGGMLLAGWLLRRYSFTESYGWLYLASATGATLAITVFLLIRDPAENAPDETPPRFSQLLLAGAASLKHANFRAILLGRCLSLAGFCIGPFIAVYFRSAAGGHLADSLIVSLGSAQTLGAAISCIGFGKIGDRLGHRFGFIVGTTFQIACLLSVLLIPGVAGCLLAFLFAGGVIGVVTISYMNLVIESCPHARRAAHLVVGNLIVGPAAVILPMLGSRLAQALGLRALMLESLALSCIALAWITLRVRDPRRLRVESFHPRLNIQH
jgi:MFS family permease